MEDYDDVLRTVGGMHAGMADGRIVGVLQGDAPANPPEFSGGAPDGPAGQAHQFSGPAIRTGFDLVIRTEDVREVQELEAMTQRHEALVLLIGNVYKALAHGDTGRGEIADLILDAATTDERLLHRLIAIDDRNG